jgi:hypothetical protein
MAFSLAVELLNMRIRRHPVALPVAGKSGE